ncbi:MAG: metallophosphoesterase [Candidatus Dormibacteraeota bacterium]|uniref:Metallophosphoesterase n=1 Tax=Candidatus Dormiibacter inghamiae TaxID=3127013 RepID=A0A934KFP0_9BACT|nr:metallophosphoesterase [Candidatus Dormibacteraeota bacterium]MBJ7606000.1 metallophosphoesterase [Candidatus Dormibacteraeota bacterium]
MNDREAASDLPVLIVGDVHGDLERLFKAVRPYPDCDWRTIFLGDLVDRGPFGVGALRYARDRANSDVLLGNHEVALLWALRQPDIRTYWLSWGGQPHDLDELAKDQQLQDWLRQRPLLMKLSDGTLIQHTGTDRYDALLEDRGAEPVTEINRCGRMLLENEREDLLWDVLSGPNVLGQEFRLQNWLRRMSTPRIVHGHVPHRGREPLIYHGGRALNYDGGLSRYESSAGRRGGGSAGATVAPLPPLGHH